MKLGLTGTRCVGAARSMPIRIVGALLLEAAMLGTCYLASAAISDNRSKADDVNWEAIAQCESGGNWAASNGGGLRISQATWNANGGAGTPAAASRQQQIKVADNIMAAQGPSAWPRCGSCSRGEAPVGSLTYVLTFLAAQSGGCAGTNKD